MLILTGSISAQKNIADAQNYLDQKLKKTSSLILSTKQQDIINADIAQARIDLNISVNNYDVMNIINLYFIIKNGKTYSFRELDNLITSREFLEAINPKFKLQTNEDAEKLRAVLGTLDKKIIRRGKVFKKTGYWGFSWEDWFGEIKYYKVKVSPKGKIIKIQKAKEKIEITEIPVNRSLYYENENLSLDGSHKKLLDKGLKRVLRTYKFTVKPLEIENLSLNLDLLDVNLGILKLYDDGYAEGNNQNFILINENQKFKTISNKEELLYDKSFQKAVAQKHKIRNQNEAEKFEGIINQLIQNAKPEYRKVYKKENIWYFIRDKFFDDLSGVLVLVNSKGEILHIEYFNKITDEAITKMKTHDPNFKLDYQFKLVEPATKKITASPNDRVRVNITFNENAVNANNCYIATYLNDEMMGFSTASSMESPFRDKIPVSELNQNGKNSIKYALMPAGKRDVKDAIEVIEIEVEVKN